MVVTGYIFPVTNSGGGGGASDPAKQDKYKFLRVNAGETADLVTDEYTDIFVYGGTLKVSDITAFRNIKSLILSAGSTIDSTSALPAINIELEHQPLPFVLDTDLAFAGFTDGSIPIFERVRELATALGQSDTMPISQKAVTNAGFVTNAVNDLVNYYTKSETYTQTEVNNLIGALATIRFEVVTELPASGQDNYIYLKLSSPGGASDIYDEFIWANGAWEQIGTTAVDLTNYVSKTGNETIDGVKTFTSPVKTNGVEGISAVEPMRVFGQGAVQIQAGAKEVWLEGDAVYPGTEIDIGKTDKKFKDLYLSGAIHGGNIPTKTSDITNDSGFITKDAADLTNYYTKTETDSALSGKVSKTGAETVSGIKTFTSKIKAPSYRSNVANNPVEVRGNAVEIVATEVGTDTVKSKVTLMAADGTNEASLFPWDNGVLNLGNSAQQYKDLYLSGNIHGAGNKQDASNYFRIDTADTSLATNEYTDIFAISGSVILDSPFDGKQIKTFYVNKGVEIKPGTSSVTKINVDFEEKTLPYITDDKMYLVGRTRNDCMLFHRENSVVLTSPNNTKYRIKVADDGTLSTELVQ